MIRGVDWVVGLGALVVMASGCSASAPLAPARSPLGLIEPAPPAEPVEGAVLWGTVKELNGSTAVIALRENRTVNVDFGDAQKAGRSVIPTVGENVVVYGTLSAGIIRARVMNRAKGPGSWGADKAE